MKQTLNTLLRMRGFLVTLTLLGLFGYAGYQVSRIIAVSPDKAYLEKAKNDAGAKTVKLDVKAVEQLKNIVPIDVKADLSNIGKPDPFN